jgi:hypothetical protein
MSRAQDAKGTAAASPSRPVSGRRRRVTAGDLAALRREVWFAVRRIGDVLDNQDATSEEVCRAANALAALANAYRGVSETVDLLPRLEALEAAVKESHQARRGLAGGRIMSLRSRAERMERAAHEHQTERDWKAMQRRLDELEAHALARLTDGGSRQPTRWQIWYLDEGEATKEREYPAQVFTEAQMEALPRPSGTRRIVVEYVNAAAPVPLLEPLDTADRPGD